MIFWNSKYLFFIQLKTFTSIAVVLLCNLTALAQDKDAANDKSTLFYYHTFAKNKTTRTYSKLQYTRPNNQLMSWPDYPLTAAQIEQRDKAWEQENKLSNIIAKDIITSILSKKKKVAVIPKF